MFLRIFITTLMFASSVSAQERLGVYLCDMFVTDQNDQLHYLKESPLFNHELTDPVSFPPVSVGVKTAADFKGDIDFPGSVHYRFFASDPGDNLTGFELPGTTQGFFEVMYSHNGVGAKATGVSSIFSPNVVLAQVNTENLKEVGLVCTPYKDQD